MQDTVTPVLLGADLNCYSMARAFYEAYGLVSRVFGREELGPIRASRYCHFTRVEELSDPAVCRAVLLHYAGTEPGRTKLLLPCTDEYAAILIQEKEALEPEYILPQPSRDALALFEKTAFYRLCGEWGIEVPETEVYEGSISPARAMESGRRLGFPYIVKPSSSIVYWHHPFADMQKVYLVHSAQEAADTVNRIYASGYEGEVLAQRYLSGGDSAGYVLTLYFDREGRCIARAAGRVLLEERTPRGRGNYAALLSVPVPPIAERLEEMLHSVHYRGFANFDLRENGPGGKLLPLELNLRQGRSNHFLTAGGINPAILLCEDYILGRHLPRVDMTAPLLFRTVPFPVVYRYTEDRVLAERARELHRSGREGNPWNARSDLIGNPRRMLYLTMHNWRERKKFRKYCAEERGI